MRLTLLLTTAMLQTGCVTMVPLVCTMSITVTTATAAMGHMDSFVNTVTVSQVGKYCLQHLLLANFTSTKSMFGCCVLFNMLGKLSLFQMSSVCILPVTIT